MNNIQYTWIQGLQRCKFAPGTTEKRFVRDAQSWPVSKELTEKQAAFLEKTAWRYRKQLACWGYKVEGYIDGDALKDAIAAAKRVEEDLKKES